jgi:23S rRNA pseudouridine1911/1915/1917 synthase
VADGRDAVTEYDAVGAGRGYTLLRLHPHTGRTHQLRAHLAYLDLPIAGDLRYGGGAGPGGLSRQFLHASGLAFERPSDGARVAVWSALPQDLRAALEETGIDTTGLPDTDYTINGQPIDPGGAR